MAKKKEHEHYTTVSEAHAGLKKAHLDAISADKASAMTSTQAALSKECAVHHAKLETEYAAMAECEKAEKPDDLVKNLPGNLGELIKALVASELEKALNQLQPLGISTVAPTRPGIVAVPRNGQQPIPISKVDPSIAHIVADLTDESMNQI
jgi:hypothetical protein